MSKRAAFECATCSDGLWYSPLLKRVKVLKETGLNLTPLLQRYKHFTQEQRDRCYHAVNVPLPLPTVALLRTQDGDSLRAFIQWDLDAMVVGVLITQYGKYYWGETVLFAVGEFSKDELESPPQQRGLMAALGILGELREYRTGTEQIHFGYQVLDWIRRAEQQLCPDQPWPREIKDDPFARKPGQIRLYVAPRESD